MVRTGVFVKPHPDFSEKEVGNKHKKHVSVPGIPRTRLAMAYPQVTLALLETLLNGPAQGGRAD